MKLWTGLLLLMVSTSGGRSCIATEPLAVDIPTDQRVRFRNPDGSCVQCSIGMCGVNQNVPSAELLLWNSEYGRPVRGGSGPDRVQAYCEQRGIRAWNVTGSDTYAWMTWACETGRGAAIGFDWNHMQTLCGHDSERNVWYICDNNRPTVVYAVSDSEFRRRHANSGQWCVILDYPPPNAPPAVVAWW